MLDERSLKYVLNCRMKFIFFNHFRRWMKRYLLMTMCLVTILQGIVMSTLYTTLYPSMLSVAMNDTA